MAAENGNGDDTRRLSVSERRITEIVENAVLKLQVELGKLYASKSDFDRVEKDMGKEFDRLNKLMEAQDTKVDKLEKEKAGRDAVTSYKKWIIGGGVFTTLFAASQLAISLYVVSRHGGK